MKLKRTEEMENYIQNYMWWDIEDTRIMYNNFCDEFDINLSFDIIENDNSIMASTRCSKINHSIIVEWCCREYDDTAFYKDIIDYIIELNNEAEEIRRKIDDFISEDE